MTTQLNDLSERISDTRPQRRFDADLAGDRSSGTRDAAGSREGFSGPNSALDGMHASRSTRRPRAQVDERS